MYSDGHLVKDAKRLPLNLLDALRAFEDSLTLKTALGEAFVKSYAKLKHNEWLEYTAHLSEWERAATLDC
jgi:glutamine synthetase